MINVEAHAMLIAEGHSKEDQILLVKIGKYIGFCVYRRSYQVLTMDGKRKNNTNRTYVSVHTELRRVPLFVSGA